jgi:Uma2 family endonuclease
MSGRDEPKSGGKVREQSAAYNETGTTGRIPMIENRYEIVDGVRYECSPSPTVNHQLLVTGISQSIYLTCASRGTVLVAPVDVYFDEDNIYQPDVIYISHDNAHIIKTARIEGAPDLVVEILSPSTSANDKIRKKANYARFGVKEYWIADPVHRTIDQFILEGNTFGLYGTYSPQDVLTSPRFSCIGVDLHSLFRNLRADD